MSDLDLPGRRLEDAVTAIERTILTSSPEFAGAEIRVEPRQWFCPDGEKIDVDVYVSVGKDPMYGSIFLFECKNWNEKVGPEPIVYFGRKIELLNATRGFFIAKRFTRYARNTAKKYPRMKLLLCNETIDPIVEFPNFHSLDPKLISTKAEIAGSWNQEQADLIGDRPASKLMLTSGEGTISLEEFTRSRGINIANEDSQREGTGLWPSGYYDRTYNRTYQFDEGTVTLERISCSSITVYVDVQIIIRRSVAKIQIGVASRGRAILFEDWEMVEGMMVRMTMVKEDSAPGTESTIVLEQILPEASKPPRKRRGKK